MEAGGGPQNITSEASEFGPKSKKNEEKWPQEIKKGNKVRTGNNWLPVDRVRRSGLGQPATHSSQ